MMTALYPNDLPQKRVGAANAKAALTLAVAAVGLASAYVLGTDQTSNTALDWLLPVGSASALLAAAMSLRAKHDAAQHWLAAGTLTLAGAAAVATGLISPFEATIAAGSLIVGFAFASGKSTVENKLQVTKSETDIGQPISDSALSGAFFGLDVIEIDPRSKVLAGGDLVKTDTLLFERVHIADRPAFLMACTNAIGATQELTVRWQLNDATHFAPINIKIQTIGHRLFVAFSVVDKEAGHIHQLSRELAHELRAPLAAMVGMADALAQSQNCTDEMRANYPALIATAGRNMIELTSSILETETDQSVKPQAKLGAVVKDCVALLQPMATQKSITLFNRLPAVFAEKEVDAGALRQILTNLISNAVKFSSDKSSVEICAMTSSNGWIICVNDNGVGIAPADVARLGRHNFRSEKTASEAGYGLGLSIVRRLVDDLGARISFESRPGKGTRVAIAFPASKLVDISDFQSQQASEPKLQTRLNKAAGAKDAAA